MWFSAAPAGPVEVFDENRGDAVVRIQRPDQLDPVGYGLVGDTAGPDRDAERMRTAQHGMPRHSGQFADPVGGQPELLVQVTKGLVRHGPAVLAIPASTAAGPDAVPAKPVPDRPLRQAGDRAYLP